MPFELKGVKCNETTYTLNNNSTDFTELSRSTSKIYNHNITQRKCECPDKEKILEKAKEYGLKKLQNESLEERELRLKKHREYMRARRKNESSEQREKRLAKHRTYKKLVKGIEGPNSNSLKSGLNNHKLLEKKEKRLEKAKEYRLKKLQNESLEERELRLRKRREYMNARRKNESSEQIVKRSGKRTEDPNNNSLKSGSNSHNTIDMKQLIKDFHNLVSNGPLYRCTCCDQLWYKHSVLPADRIRLANLNIVKYLQNIKSFHNVEWLCNTCSNHLRKGRVPPWQMASSFQKNLISLTLMN